MLTPPVLFQGIFLFSVIKYQPLTYEERPYPKWAEGLGWIIACASMLCVPITAVKVLCNAEGSSLGVLTFLECFYALEYQSEKSALKYKILGGTLTNWYSLAKKRK